MKGFSLGASSDDQKINAPRVNDGGGAHAWFLKHVENSAVSADDVENSFRTVIDHTLLKCNERSYNKICVRFVRHGEPKCRLIDQTFLALLFDRRHGVKVLDFISLEIAHAACAFGSEALVSSSHAGPYSSRSSSTESRRD